MRREIIRYECDVCHKDVGSEDNLLKLIIVRKEENAFKPGKVEMCKACAKRLYEAYSDELTYEHRDWRPYNEHELHWNDDESVTATEWDDTEQFYVKCPKCGHTSDTRHFHKGDKCRVCGAKVYW